MVQKVLPSCRAVTCLRLRFKTMNLLLAGSSVVLDSFTLNNILPKKKDVFFRYQGSLTTPPCSPAVIWSVFRNTIGISQNQVHFLFCNRTWKLWRQWQMQNCPRGPTPETLNRCVQVSEAQETGFRCFDLQYDPHKKKKQELKERKHRLIRLYCRSNDLRENWTAFQTRTETEHVSSAH